MRPPSSTLTYPLLPYTSLFRDQSFSGRIMAFEIQDGIHLCVCGDQVILLDLQAERYFALPHSQNDILRRWLTNQAIGDHEAAALRRLEQLRILRSTVGDCDGTDPKIPEVPAPVAGLDTMGVRSSLQGIIAALFARMVWAWRIKHWRFDRQMRRLREPRRRATSRRPADARQIVDRKSTRLNSSH